MNDQQKIIYELGLDDGYRRGVSDVLDSLSRAAEQLRKTKRGTVISKETGKTYNVVLESPHHHLASICDQIAEAIKQELKHHDHDPGPARGPTPTRPN